MTAKKTAEAPAQTATAPVATRPPLTATQSKTLEKIIAGDFKSLASEVVAEIDRWQITKVAEVERDYKQAEKEIAKITKQAIALESELRLRAQRFVDEQKDAGYQQSAYGSAVAVHVPQNWSPAGKDEAIVAIRRQAEAARTRALGLIDRRRIDAQRSILLSCLNSQAAVDLLTTIPSAADVLSEALKPVQAQLTS